MVPFGAVDPGPGDRRRDGRGEPVNHVAKPESQSGAIPARPKQFGKYLLLEKVGSGGMAEIFKAVIRGVGDFQKVLVVKRILLAYSRDPTFVKMFTDEARITAPLQHSNIVSIYEFDQVDGQYYLAMEFVNGRDLQRVMSRANKLGRAIPVEVALHIVGEVCKALWYAYNARDARGSPLRIIHRDVSPSNILISFDGEVKVTDFGVAKAANSTAREATGAGGLKGKLGYMSPEQVLGRDVDHRSDIFSLGIVLFETLTLKRMFLGRTDLQTLMNVRDADVERRLGRHPEIPEVVADVIRKALAKAPEKRFRGANDFQSSIQDVLYERGKRVGQDTVAAFMRDMFAEEAEQEILPLEIEEVSEVRRSPLERIAEPAPEATEPPEPARPPTPPPAAAGSKRRQSEEMAPLPLDEGGNAPPEETRSRKVAPLDTAFRIRDSFGNVFGPVSLNNLLSLLASRAVTEDEFCQVNDGEWTRVGDVTALQGRIEPPPPEVKKTPLFEGGIDRLATLRLLCDISRNKKLTGLLTFRHQSTQKEVYFRAGRPRFVFSNQRSELLGEYLVRQGRVSADQLADALRRVREVKGARIGDALIASGLVTAHQLADLLQAQFRDRFLDLFRWESGWYGFFEGAQGPKNAVPSELDPVAVMAEAVRTLYPVDVCRAWLADHLERRLGQVENARIQVQELHLHPRELRVVNLLESNDSVARLVKALPPTPESQAIAFRTVFLLIQCGIYVFKGSGPSTRISR
jgi:serine/threonine-protein kinase